MKKAQEFFHSHAADHLPSSLLELYRSTGVVASHYPDETWSLEFPNEANRHDYQQICFLAYRPVSERPIVVAEIVVSMRQDDPFILVRWHPTA
jgi:hypothetical protein